MIITLATAILLISNVFGVICSVILIAFGIFLGWCQNTIMDLLKRMIMRYGNPGPEFKLTPEKVEIAVGEYMVLLFHIGCILLSFGIILLLVSCIGLSGTIKKSRWLLNIYWILVALHLLAILLLVCFMPYCRSAAKIACKRYFRSYIRNKFVGIQDQNITDIPTLLLSYIMAKFSCCGIYNSSDFSQENAPLWKRIFVLQLDPKLVRNITVKIPESIGNITGKIPKSIGNITGNIPKLIGNITGNIPKLIGNITGNISIPIEKLKLNITLKIPLACCKMKSNSFEPADPTCIHTPDDSNSNMNIGCFQKLWKVVDNYAIKFHIGLIGPIALLAVVCASAIVLCVEYGKHRVMPESNIRA